MDTRKDERSGRRNQSRRHPVLLSKVPSRQELTTDFLAEAWKPLAFGSFSHRNTCSFPATPQVGISKRNIANCVHPDQQLQSHQQRQRPSLVKFMLHISKIYRKSAWRHLPRVQGARFLGTIIRRLTMRRTTDLYCNSSRRINGRATLRLSNSNKDGPALTTRSLHLILKRPLLLTK